MSIVRHISKVPQWVALYGVVFFVFMGTASALHHSEPVKQARMERQVASVEVRSVQVTTTPKPNEFASSISNDAADEATGSSELVSLDDPDTEVQASPTPEFRELLLEEAASTRSATSSPSATN